MAFRCFVGVKVACGGSSDRSATIWTRLLITGSVVAGVRRVVDVTVTLSVPSVLKIGALRSHGEEGRWERGSERSAPRLSTSVFSTYWLPFGSEGHEPKDRLNSLCLFANTEPLHFREVHLRKPKPDFTLLGRRFRASQVPKYPSLKLN